MLTFSKTAKWVVYWQAVSFIGQLSSNSCFYSRDVVFKLLNLHFCEWKVWFYLAVNNKPGFNYSFYLYLFFNYFLWSKVFHKSPFPPIDPPTPNPSHLGQAPTNFNYIWKVYAVKYIAISTSFEVMNPLRI